MRDTTKPPMIHNVQKLKKKASPIFFQNNWNDWVENVSMRRSVKLGCAFFFSKCRSYKILQPLQNPYHRKPRFFCSVFSIWPRLTYVDSICQRKKIRTWIGL
jgi:hypothetical protein